VHVQTNETNESMLELFGASFSSLDPLYPCPWWGPISLLD